MDLSAFSRSIWGTIYGLRISTFLSTSSGGIRIHWNVYLSMICMSMLICFLFWIWEKTTTMVLACNVLLLATQTFQYHSKNNRVQWDVWQSTFNWDAASLLRMWPPQLGTNMFRPYGCGCSPVTKPQPPISRSVATSSPWCHTETVGSMGVCGCKTMP